MKHFTSPKFWKAYDELPLKIRELADKNYQLLKTAPDHPSLHFKKVGKMWSVRVGAHYRALAFDNDGDMLWFWIGSHADYDKLMP